MAPSEKKENLFSAFPPVSTREWEQVILKDLKGADYRKKLVWNSPEGIPVKPYYRSEDLDKLSSSEFNPLNFSFLKESSGSPNTWLIRQDIQADNIPVAREKALWLLSRGVEYIGFVADEPHTGEEVSELVGGLPLAEASFGFEGFHPGQVLDALDSLADAGRIDPAAVKGSLEWDLAGGLTIFGSFEYDEDEEYTDLANWLSRAGRYPNLRIIGIHGRNFNNAGSTITQELAFSLAQASDCLAELTDLGLDAAAVASRISFHLSAGSNYFMEIAKFRAARMLWARMLEEYRVGTSEIPPMCLQAETSRWNVTVYDSYVNLLRTTTEAMSAAIGGADVITVLPFDMAFEEPTPFAERLARNQQILLREEAHLDKVADPAAGSYFVETLTASIAEAAWKLFRETEERGGYTESFLEGWIQDQVVTAAMERDQNLAQRREILLGTNQFPDPSEEMVPKADSSRAISGVMDSESVEAQPLNLYRGAELFESLRFAAERAEKRPVAFMLTIGNLAMRKARAGFSCNFFGCAGYRVIDNNGFSSLEEGVKAAFDRSADIIVLCSSDEEYAAYGEPFARLVAGKAIPVIAGYPKELVEPLQAAGISHFIHVRSNLLQTLREFNKLILNQ